ncbi:MAG: class I SAM-dependent methyltransferase [Nitrospiria bacterium]
MRKVKKGIGEILKKNEMGIRLDIGCGAAKQKGFVGMDIRSMPGVDIVHDIEKFPWPLPNECASLVMTSHLLEHLHKGGVDSRLIGLVKLLKEKNIITQSEVDEYLGEIDPGPIFLRFMDEVWRITKPGGQFVSALPYGGSPGFLQDPTHIAQFNVSTWAYFDPLAQNSPLYGIYEPAPWKVLRCTYGIEGNMEVILEKRVDDISYHADRKLHFGKSTFNK